MHITAKKNSPFVVSTLLQKNCTGTHAVTATDKESGHAKMGWLIPLQGGRIRGGLSRKRGELAVGIRANRLRFKTKLSPVEPWPSPWVRKKGGVGGRSTQTGRGTTWTRRGLPRKGGDSSSRSPQGSVTVAILNTSQTLDRVGSAHVMTFPRMEESAATIGGGVNWEPTETVGRLPQEGRTFVSP